MSITDKLTQLVSIRSDIRSELVAKGVAASTHDFADFADDIESIQTGITPTGNINITDTNSTNVTNYATAQVVDADLVAGNIKKNVNILGVTGTYEGEGGDQPTLYAPTITLSSKKNLAISNPSSNGSFCNLYKIFANGTQIGTTTSTSVDLTTIYTTTGSHTITVKCAGTYFVDSSASNSITYVYPLQLDTPTNVVANNTTVSWSAVTSATSYNIYVDGTLFGNVSTVSQDLSEMSGWSALAEGGHAVTITALASGWTESEASSSVAVTKGVVINPYVTFESPNSFTIVTSTKGWNGTVQYSTDAETWTDWAANTTITGVLSGGTYKLHMRGNNNTTLCGDTFSGTPWTITGSDVSCNGILGYVFDVTKTAANECIYMNGSACSHLFANCTALVSPPSFDFNYSATGNYDFRETFSGCTNLHTLPKMRNDYACSTGMFTFNGCSNIKVSQTQDSTYQYPWVVPCQGTASGILAELLTGSGGTYTGNVVLGTIYYTDHEPV